jgi:hypothetical protein
MKHLVTILQKEKVTFDPKDVAFIVQSYFPDMRKIINFAQQSTIGTSVNGKMIVSQGFQQSKSSSAAPLKPIENKTTVFPNPITDQVNFKMDHPVPGKISFSLFDIHGRLLEHQEKEAPNQLLTINNLMLAAGEYFVKLEGTNYSFGTAILKSK